ncbi:MAG: hypothetical protein L0206_13615 [Actinobacteria bacterium]|nr:hypothetical protein [Actinomycetota bacterium]
MRARRPVALTIVALLMLWPTTAQAGGWDSLNFRRDHYIVGTVAETTDMFFAGELRGAGPLDGRAYYAYLLPRNATQSGFGMIDPPKIPEGAIRLGTLDVSAPFEPKRYEGRYARAALSFTVPDVPTGDYAIGFCDDPCEHGYVGWLAWGSIRIVHTEQEGRLLAKLDRDERDARTLRHDLRRADRETDDLQARLDAVKSDLRSERMNAVTPSERIVAVPATERDGAGPGLAMWLAVLGAIAALFVGIVLGTHRRRDVTGLVVPDTVPDDLVERVEDEHVLTR